MAERIRGRGRAIVPQEVLDAPLRRPGREDPTNPPSLSTSTTSSNSNPKTSKLGLLFNGELEDLVVYKILSIAIFKDAEDDTQIQAMMEYICKNMLDDASNATAVAKYIYVFSREPTKGDKLRQMFYTSLERLYSDREIIRKTQGVNCFRNFVKFYLAATHHTRNIHFAPFVDLVDGLMEVAGVLSQQLQTAEDVKLYCLLMLRYNEYIYMSTAQGQPFEDIGLRIAYLEAAKNVIRQQLSISRKNHEQVTIFWLMMALETNLSNEAIEFYKNVAGQYEMSPILTDSFRTIIPKGEENNYLISHLKKHLVLA